MPQKEGIWAIHSLPPPPRGPGPTLGAVLPAGPAGGGDDGAAADGGAPGARVRGAGVGRGAGRAAGRRPGAGGPQCPPTVAHGARSRRNSIFLVFKKYDSKPRICVFLIYFLICAKDTLKHSKMNFLSNGFWLILVIETFP